MQQEGATVNVDVADDAPVFEADQALVKRVFGNLLQNALTHSARAITLSLGARREGDGTLFTVADNGVGIPPEYHDIIFRKFEQVRTPHIPRDAQLGAGVGVLQAGCRGARRPHLGEERWRRELLWSGARSTSGSP